MVELDRRERELLGRERALSLRLQEFEGRVRDAWEADNRRREEEARLVAELETRTDRIAELERMLAVSGNRTTA